jgi:fructokinase
MLWLMASANNAQIYGAVEAGGTKFVCAMADADGNLKALERFPTLDPKTTLNAACEFFRGASKTHGAPRAIGVACFGPIHLDRSTERYGFIGKTPKAGWSHTDMVGMLSREFGCPIGFDTDVNAAALAEHRWGAAQEVGDMVYLTVGTGIGGGVLQQGVPLHGLMHPEIGHVWPRRHALDPEFKGVCPFHGDCMEGLASGPAIVARSGAELGTLPQSHPQWQIEADYLGQLCAQLTLIVSPQRIVLGGGVMGHAGLCAPIRARTLHWLAGYVDRDAVLSGMDRYIVPPALQGNAGVLGGLVLALEAEARG